MAKTFKQFMSENKLKKMDLYHYKDLYNKGLLPDKPEKEKKKQKPKEPSDWALDKDLRNKGYKK